MSSNKSVFYTSALALVVALACASTGLYAQAKNVRARVILGIMGSQIDGDRLKGYDKPGLVAGMAMELRIAPKVTVQPELFYSQKGARSTNKSPVYSVVRLTYLDIAVPLNIYLKENLVLQPGVGYGILLKAVADIGYGFVSADHVFEKSDLYYLAGVEYHFTPRTAANIRLSYSLASIHKDIQQYNNSLTFGLRFYLGNNSQ